MLLTVTTRDGDTGARRSSPDRSRRLLLPLLRIATGENDIGTGNGQRPSRDQSEAAVGAGDDDSATFPVGNLLRGPLLGH
jgi:hypothetical protein